MITDAHLDELRTLFIRHGVVLAYLFGSQAEGTARESSDVDIAVLLAPGILRDNFFDVRLALTNELMTLFHKDVDVAVLNQVNALLAYEVVQHGVVLYEDPTTHPTQDFVVSATLYYADTADFRGVSRTYLREEVEHYRATHALALKEVAR